jgi:Domain of unknown function (DUF5753)
VRLCVTARCQLARRWDGGHPAWFTEWVDSERRATLLRAWEPLLIPGLLQTPGYARGDRVGPVQDQNSGGPTQAVDALLALNEAADAALAAGQDAIDAETRTKHEDWYRQAAATGITLSAARQGKLRQKRHALATRMKDREGDYLRFARAFQGSPWIPGTG